MSTPISKHSSAPDQYSEPIAGIPTIRDSRCSMHGWPPSSRTLQNPRLNRRASWGTQGYVSPNRPQIHPGRQPWATARMGVATVWETSCVLFRELVIKDLKGQGRQYLRRKKKGSIPTIKKNTPTQKNIWISGVQLVAARKRYTGTLSSPVIKETGPGGAVGWWTDGLWEQPSSRSKLRGMSNLSEDSQRQRRPHCKHQIWAAKHTAIICKGYFRFTIKTLSTTIVVRTNPSKQEKNTLASRRYAKSFVSLSETRNARGKISVDRKEFYTEDIECPTCTQ